MNEKNRINFYIERDGDAQTKIWALQTYKIYRTAVYGKAKKTRWMRDKTFKPKFIESLLELRKYLNEQTP